VRELLFEQIQATTIREDNKVAILIAKNLKQPKAAKHIEVRYHFIRECLERKEISLEYIETGSQLADIMTKPLGRTLFEKHRGSLLNGPGT